MLYISSDRIHASCSSASRTTASTSSLGITPPVGFAGELSTMSLGARSRTKAASFAMSKDAPSGRSGAATGTPPATSIMARYVGNPGSGYTTVSPGLTSASVGKNKPGFAPGPTTISSGRTSTSLVSETCAAMASRNEGAPSGAAYLVLPPRMAPTPASTTCSGVANPGCPISRWTISRPSRSNAVALASTAYAPSFCR